MQISKSDQASKQATTLWWPTKMWRAMAWDHVQTLNIGNYLVGTYKYRSTIFHLHLSLFPLESGG